MSARQVVEALRKLEGGPYAERTEHTAGLELAIEAAETVMRNEELAREELSARILELAGGGLAVVPGDTPIRIVVPEAIPQGGRAEAVRAGVARLEANLARAIREVAEEANR